ncbi:hypothetical protein TWF694_008306 [Orbilia ellipsospora]|uniref:Uncharacterized protein n=1 Tax=Orbilia ellipsospora TaxID=2528407 RepID=A0AAV9XJ30_9PEZI
MDFLSDFAKKAQGGEQKPAEGQQNPPKQEGGSLFDQASKYMNEAAGGGQKGEKKEDYLDKGIDMFQDKILHQGPQDNESAAEQQKDNMIAGGIRDGYKKFTGNDFPGQGK